MKYLNLIELTKKYEKLFTNICKKSEKYGSYDYLTEYEVIKEVCRELYIDTDEIEDNIFS